MHAGFGLYCAWIVLSSILLVAYDYTLRILATCPCIQPGGALHGVCFCCRDCFKDAGKQGLYVVAFDPVFYKQDLRVAGVFINR